MKKINLFSRMWRSGGNSQSKDVGFDRRFTVGSPSGLESSTVLKFVSVLVLVLTIGVGNVWGAIDANSTWTATAWASIPNGSTFIIANNCDKAMYNGNGTSSAPSQVSISYNSTTKKITVNTAGKSLDDIAWIYSKPSSTVTIKSFADDSKNLYTTNNNNGLRVGTTACTYSMGAMGRLLLASTYTKYVGTYSTSDWRSYGTENAANYTSSCSDQALVFYVLDEASCDNSVTIKAGTNTNCTFTLSPSGAQASCDGVTATVSITPTTGYGNPVVTQSGASASPSISGGGTNSQTVTYEANTTGTSTINVSCSANTYTITLNKDLTPDVAGTASITATYNSNSNLTSAITKPTATGWTFAGYFTAKNGGGTQIIGADGNVIASVSGYTDGSKNWKYAGNITLYAKWTCTVTWSVDTHTDVYSTQTVTYNSSGCKVASVPGPPSPATYCGDKFAGWSRKNAGTESKTTSYYDDLFTDVTGSPALQSIGDVTFYAVFADYDD